MARLLDDTFTPDSDTAWAYIAAAGGVPTGPQSWNYRKADRTLTLTLALPGGGGAGGGRVRAAVAQPPATPAPAPEESTVYCLLAGPPSLPADLDAKICAPTSRLRTCSRPVRYRRR
jgi:hypothetical protein